jgi:cytochrome c556
MRKEVRARISIALVAVAALVSIAVAGATGTEAIKARHQAMESIKDSMMVFVSMAKKETPFDAEAVQAAAKAMELDLKKATRLFSEGSEKGDVETWAMPEIWSDRENFEKVFKSSVEAAMAMQSVEEEAALMPALGALGTSCKTCHDKYRRPKS